MLKKAFFVFLAVATLATGLFAAVPPAGHVVVVMEENHSYSSVIGCSCMPYLNSLANKYGLATKYYANTHPSIGNYFMLTTGQIITNNDSYNSVVTNDNLVRHMLAAGKTWKSYAESLPYAGYTGWDTGYYVKHHNPLAFFSDVVNSSNQVQNLVPFPQFATDLNNGQLPDFSFVVPNINDDAHNGTLQQADSWLQTNIGPLLSNPTFQQDGLLIIVFDEGASSDTSYGGGQVAMVMVGPKVTPGFKSSTLYQEQNLLRTAMDAMGVTTYPGAASTAADMSDFFGSSSTTSTTSTTSTSGGVVLSSPTSGSTVGSPIQVTASATGNNGLPITGMYVYLDNVAVYHNSSSSLSTSVTASAGTHTIMVKAWDSQGTIYQNSATVTVGSTSTTSTTTTSGTGSVVLSSPTNGSTVSSPMQVTASATGSNGLPITGMYVYLDNVAVYNTAAASLSTSVNATAGTHTVLVKAWDSHGAIYQSSATVTVGSASTSTTTTTSTAGSVVLSSPTAGSGVGSPIQVTASATGSNGLPITGMYVYLDNVAVYHNSSNSVSTSVSASTGTHTVLVKAWDSQGTIYQNSATVNINSSSGAVSITSPQQGATAGSPVLVQASATGGSYPITGMWVYVDNVGVYNTGSASLSTYLSLAAGTHTVLVKGWNSQGTIFQNSVSVSVN